MQVLSETRYNIYGLITIKCKIDEENTSHLVGIRCSDKDGKSLFIALNTETKNAEFSKFVEAYDILAAYSWEENRLRALDQQPEFSKLLLLTNTEHQVSLSNDIAARRFLGLQPEVFFQNNQPVSVMVPKLAGNSFASEFTQWGLRKSQELARREPNSLLKRQYQLSIGLLKLICDMHVRKLIFRSLRVDDLRVLGADNALELIPIHYLNTWKMQSPNTASPFEKALEMENLRGISIAQCEAVFLSALLRKIWGFHDASPSSSPTISVRKSADMGSNATSASHVSMFKPVFNVEALNTMNPDIEDFIQALTIELPKTAPDIYIAACPVILRVLQKRLFERHLHHDVARELTATTHLEADEHSPLLAEHQESTCCTIL